MAKEAKNASEQENHEQAAPVVETTTEETVTAPVEVEQEQVIEVEDDQPLAKAGKRSAKGLKEAEEKQAKEERKAHASEVKAEEDKPKQPVKPPRTRLERQGKKFRKAAELIEKGKTYSLTEAIDLAIKTSPVKFDATLELHINLNVDPKHADQNIRGNLVLPAGTGKTVRVALLDDQKVEGADIHGVEAVLAQLEKGVIDFDILIATPAQMPKLGKYARLLGPKGLMPNPKSGTVTTDPAKAVSEAKAGRVEYRVDSTGIAHVGCGKVSFGAKKLEDNVRAIFSSIKNSKPASVKSNYVKAIHLATTMGPSITVAASEL